MAATGESDSLTTLGGDDENIAASRQALLEEIAAAEAHLTEVQRIPKAQERAEKALHSFAVRQASSTASQGGGSAAACKPRNAVTAAGNSSTSSKDASLNKVELAKHSEETAKRRLAEVQRQLDKSKIAVSRTEVHTRNHRVVQTMRAQARNDALRMLLSGSTAAGEEELQRLSETFNLQMTELIENATPESWTKLFRLVDADGSGRITFDELCNLTRSEFGLLPADISDEALKSIWLALDADDSGYVTAGEFGQFMRRGRYLLVKHTTTWKERLVAARRASAAQQRREREDLYENDMQRRTDGAVAACEGDISLLARLCFSRLAEQSEDGEGPSSVWADLFMSAATEDAKLDFDGFTRWARNRAGRG